MELKLKKCDKCGALIVALKDCNCDNCGIKCCGEAMSEVIVNSDGAVEKHLPVYEKRGDDILVKVNHVMDEDHYIEWISTVSGNKINTISFNPGDEVSYVFKYEKGMKIYSYCNKHGLWVCDVD